MADVELSEAFFANIAGWEAMKHARALVAQGQVLSSNWTPPILKGVVQEGSISYRAGLVIKSAVDVENMCSCRQSREWGTMCAHSIGVGVLHLRKNQPLPPLPKKSEGKSPTGAAPMATKAPVRQLQRDADGEPAEIFVILPPNPGAALAKGKIMLCFEAKWRNGRTPLNVLPPSVGFQFSPQDNALLDVMEELSNGEAPGMIMITTEAFAAVLPKLIEHPRITLGKTQAVEVPREPWRLAVKATLEESGEISLALKSSGPLPTLIAGKSLWVMHGQTIQQLGLPGGCLEMIKGPLKIPRPRVPQFLSQDWAQLQTGCGVTANFKLEDFILEPQPPRILLDLAGGLALLHAQLQCAYGPRIMPVGVAAAAESLWLPDPANVRRYSTRDLAAEQAALARLRRIGFAGPDPQGRYVLSGQNQVLSFFAREFTRLQKEWTVTLEERLERSTTQNLERIEPQFQITPSGVQWFDLGVVFASAGGERFSAADIQRLVLSGQGHTRLRNGKLAVIDTEAVAELQEVLLDCSPQQHGQGYRIANTQAGFLEATLRQQGRWQVQAPPAWRDRARQQSGEARLVCPPLDDLETVLRPYQKQGVAWLQFLRVNGFGGILADEMGLGKTLQTLAFLRATRRAGNPPPTLPTLVVCPTSLVFNWVAEATRFTPDLKVLALNGPQRHALFERISSSDLIVTSYALIRRDADRYRELEFDTVVLDEAQHIKNRQTQNAHAVKAVRAQHRIVLTGTPLENSVLDLWSIFDFLMPGYLGAAQDFRERYEMPITREKNSEAQARLGRRLRPFILRRLKKEVAQDLPARLEQVSFCEMTDDQRAVYQQVIEASRKEILDAVGAQGLAKSRMVVLSALLRLRQICCDVRLLKLDNTDPANSSGKLDMFSELLEEIIDGGHRVLVFSQFVTMLTILREKLAADGIDYCYLDGSTNNRGEVVQRFQGNNQIPVFLISLKAGGVGLNLTGADTVIHFDPWWNPAVEDQATDRAHRIGQHRVVTSYKLITRDTVEEKILTLQNRKREIIQATLGGEEQLAESLSWEEIQDLLA